MDNISDPDYVREVGILADAMTKRYAHHPAVIAVGYNNEIGNGFMSYSEADRQRFIAWLKKKYGTIEELNKAWATQRWSRRLNSFEDVDLPLGRRAWTFRALSGSPPLLVRCLRWPGSRNSMRSATAICRMFHRSRICGTTASRRGFDYLATYKSYVSYGAEGFYPG